MRRSKVTGPGVGERNGEAGGTGFVRGLPRAHSYLPRKRASLGVPARDRAWMAAPAKGATTTNRCVTTTAG